MVILWVNFRVRPPPSWNSVFGTTWLRFSSRSRFRARARNLVGPGPDDDGNIVKKVWQTDRRTDRRTENTIHRAAWSQLKTARGSDLNRTSCYSGSLQWHEQMNSGPTHHCDASLVFSTLQLCHTPVRWLFSIAYLSHVRSQFCQESVVAIWAVCHT